MYRTDVAEPIYTGNAAVDAPPPLNVLGQTVILESNQRIIATDGEDTVVVAQFGQEFGDGSKLDLLIRPSPDIDGVGRVAYFGSIQALSEPFPCDDKILLSGLNPPIELSEGGILRDDCPFRLLDVLMPIALNDAGSAAFVGNFSTASGDTVKAVFVDRTVFWEERSEGFEDFFEIRSVALNDAGLVAYVLGGLGGSPGTVLFTGRPPNHDRVLGTGDALCDGTVSSLAFHR